uniref:Uncharacterized protein n=1 Tax=Macaca fascicularis TaxID=9541 RepID=A0A7N9D3C7_MACFA
MAPHLGGRLRFLDGLGASQDSTAQMAGQSRASKTIRSMWYPRHNTRPCGICQTRARVLSSQAYAGYAGRPSARGTGRPLQAHQPGSSGPFGQLPRHGHLVLLHPVPVGLSEKTPTLWALRMCPARPQLREDLQDSWRFLQWNSMPQLPMDLDVGGPWFPHYDFEQSCWVCVPSECVLDGPGTVGQGQLGKPAGTLTPGPAQAHQD